jgi:glycosyltransferase involved in cell wall biosynthesis
MSLVALDARLAGGDSTGDSTYWTGLLRGLAKTDSPHHFLLFSNGPRPSGIPDSEKFRWVELSSRSSRWWSLVRFPLAARRAGARAIHTQYNLSPLVGKVGITTIHDVSFFVGPHWFRPRDLMLLRRFVPASARRAAKVVTVSETSRGEIERYLPGARGKVTVALNGPHPDLDPVPREEARAFVRTELGLEGPFLLAVGTRWPRKNMALAIEACERLGPELPHRLALTGKPGWGAEPTGKRILATGYVSFDQLAALYAAADLFLCPSLHEGFGMTVVEAFHCGCPVLCSSGGALPEVAGDAARVMPDFRPSSWSRAIAELLGDSSKLESMRAQGRERAKAFTWRASAQAHLEVYREVAAR